MRKCIQRNFSIRQYLWSSPIKYLLNKLNNKSKIGIFRNNFIEFPQTVSSPLSKNSTLNSQFLLKYVAFVTKNIMVAWNMLARKTISLLYIYTHTHCCAFINSTCFYLAARNVKHRTGSMWKNQQHNVRDAGEFHVLSLPNPIHITVFLNWHIHRKELNHFIVNIRLYWYDTLLKYGVSRWLQQGLSWA